MSAKLFFVLLTTLASAYGDCDCSLGDGSQPNVDHSTQYCICPNTDIFVCKDGQVYNDALKSCESMRIVDLSTTETYCMDKDNGLYEHADCKKFYECFNSQTTVLTCPTNFKFFDCPLKTCRTAGTCCAGSTP